jgi:hypothetical protein
MHQLSLEVNLSQNLNFTGEIFLALSTPKPRSCTKYHESEFYID